MSSLIHQPGRADGLGDILERVLDKGVVIAGDVSVSLVGIELLTIRLRLIIASVDKAVEMGINWWETDPTLSANARRDQIEKQGDTEIEDLRAQNRLLLDRLEAMETQLAATGS